MAAFILKQEPNNHERLTDLDRRKLWYNHDNPVRKGLEWEATVWLFS
jgi:hypothetical protein